MAKIAGSLWVDGTTLHYVDKNGQEWYFTGTAVGFALGSVLGSVWVDTSDNTIRYIDAFNQQRSIATTLINSPLGALKGSLWIETTAANNYSLHAIMGAGTAGEYAAHTDTHDDGGSAHGDHDDGVSGHHTDTPALHSDSHADQPTSLGF